MHLLTLASNLKLPLYRDFLMSMGIYSVSNRSCTNILSGKAGNAITIVVGGAHESLRARPGYLDLTLNRRLGFVRIAMQTGAKLVPVLCFGENDMYEQMDNDDGSLLYYMQIKFKTIFRWTLPMFVGRGLFHRSMGWMPYMRPMNVVGALLLTQSALPLRCHGSTTPRLTRSSTGARSTSRRCKGVYLLTVSGTRTRTSLCPHALTRCALSISRLVTRESCFYNVPRRRRRRTCA